MKYFKYFDIQWCQAASNENTLVYVVNGQQDSNTLCTFHKILKKVLLNLPRNI